MDATTIVALAGIFGTLLAPLLTGWLRHRHARAERLLDARIEVYADLIGAAATTADNALTWSAIPLANLPEPDDDHLNQVFARLRVVASQEVYKAAMDFKRDVSAFHHALRSARIHAARVREDGEIDDVRSIGTRMDAGEVADVVAVGFRRIEDAVRREVGR